MCFLSCFFFFFKQKTAYEMRISDWSSDVCSSDLAVQDAFDGKLEISQKRRAGLAALRDLPAITKDGVSIELMINARSEERRVGKECVSTCRSRWSPYH